MPGRLSLVGVAVYLVFLLLPIRAIAQGASHPPSDAHARNAILGDAAIVRNSLPILEQGQSLPLNERHQFLRQWVLPSDSHDTFRVAASFTPTQPIPGTQSTDNQQPTTGRRVYAGGEIVSPALELIETAAALNKLDDLRTRVGEYLPTSPDSSIAKLALLTMIDMARGDDETAGAMLDEMFSLVLADKRLFDATRDALLLCVNLAADRPQTSRLVIDAAYQITVSYEQVYDREPWHRQFSMAFGRVKHTIAHDSAGGETGIGLNETSQWLPVSRAEARYRGTGCPNPRWHTEPGRVNNLSSHTEDYLYFQSPLRGDFSVEGEVSGFGWRDTQLLVAGQWVGPVYDHESYDVSTVRGPVTRTRFAPPLTKTKDEIHYRTKIREGTASTWFNGRHIHDRQLSIGHEPWLAIRSSWRHDGGARNLWITGQPIIPQSVRLSDSPDLSGWIPYFDDVVGIDWQSSINVNGEQEIQARRQGEYPTGCHKESLLAYQRPMLEDGRIEYEFWNEPGVFDAHPALDRLCFLLRPDGVKEHWLTDGKYDRTDLGPDNIVAEPDYRRGPEMLPLIQNQWNRLVVTIAGDTVLIELNGQQVYERPLEPTNLRTFGLFHFADQTALRVRNIVWNGDWPRKLPPLSRQLLAVDETKAVDERLPDLTATFDFDFAAEGLPLDRFAVIHGDIPAHISTAEDGLHAGRPAVTGYRNATVAPSLSVGGDFDIRASFDQLVTDTRQNWTCGLMLMLLADTPVKDEASLLRRRTLGQGVNQQLVQCLRVQQRDEGEQRRYFDHLPVEATSGTLRLARRRDRIYYLFAEGDSEQFRIISEDRFPVADLLMEGVRLVAQIHGDAGTIGVVWKNLSIRAEKLKGPAVGNENSLLAQINAQRQKLVDSFSHDFKRQPPDAALFERWADRSNWNPADEGLRLAGVGTDNWTSTGAAVRQQIAGDFDVSVEFDATKLGVPPQGQRSAVYLQAELADDDATQVSAILTNSATGSRSVIGQLRIVDGDGNHHYRSIGQLGLIDATGLRLSRREHRIYVIATADEYGGEKIVTHADVGGAPILSQRTKFLVQTGGTGRTSQVIWKSITMDAAAITSDEPAPAPVTTIKTKRTPPEKRSFFDFFFK